MAIPWSRKVREASYDTTHQSINPVYRAAISIGNALYSLRHPGVYPITQNAGTGTIAPPRPAEAPARKPAPQKAPEREPKKVRHWYSNPAIVVPLAVVVLGAGIAVAAKGDDVYRHFTQKPAVQTTVQDNQQGRTNTGAPVVIDEPSVIDIPASGLLQNPDASNGTSNDISSDFVRQNEILTLEVDPAIAGELPDTLDNYFRRALEAYKFAENFFGRPLGEPAKIRIAKHPTKGIRWGWDYNPTKPEDWQGYPMSALDENDNGDVHEWAHQFVAKYMPTDSKPLNEGVAQLIQNLSFFSRAEKGEIETYDLGDCKLCGHDRLYRWGLEKELDNGLLQKDPIRLDAHEIGEYFWILVNQKQKKETDYAADRRLINFWVDRHSKTGKPIELQDVKDGLQYIGFTDEEISDITGKLKPGFDCNCYVINPP